MKILVVVDMQNDFIYGSLGSLLTQNVVDNVVAKVAEYKANGDIIIFTRDTHYEDYLETPEGKKLPVKHCIRGTEGWEIIPELNPNELSAKWAIVDKPIFGSIDLMDYFDDNDEIEFCGVCTDICVVSNALMAKSFYPNAKISVDPKCCAGTSINNHLSAIDVMRSCQIDIIETEREIGEKELVR
jgi:nicotinamidase-related amidase